MKLSTAIRELEKILNREGDLDFTSEGFFGEVLPAKLHLRHRCTKRKAYYCPALDREPGQRGEKVVQVSHL
jgi:hypothetical protein